MTYIEKYASGIMIPEFHYAHIDYGYTLIDYFVEKLRTFIQQQILVWTLL